MSTPLDESTGSAGESFRELKLQVHRRLLEHLDLVALASLDSAQAEDQVRNALQRAIAALVNDPTASESRPVLQGFRRLFSGAERRA